MALLCVLTCALSLPLPTPRVRIEPARLEAGQTLRQASLLSAEGLCAADAQPYEVPLLAAELRRELLEHFSSRNREAHALLVASDEQAGVVGVCGIEVQQLTPKAMSPRRGGDSQVRGRPLLTNVAVSRGFRRRGIGRQLCRASEALARSWGFSEILLRVEQDNTKARRLYHSLGYRTVGVDTEAERPDASSGRLEFVRTTQVVMRKDLRFPPLDTVAIRLGLLGGAVLYYPVVEPVLAEAAAGRVQSAFRMAFDLLQPVLTEAAAGDLRGAALLIGSPVASVLHGMH
ncbi:hypothetical protein AB1Y20_003970 [Prymnesium parvum]|uniref:Probable N-acetyltransferase 14 n=1 Tax=Prymnesium parvum TaxID=97485 RepID=A0AB34J674_PRYPA